MLAKPPTISKAQAIEEIVAELDGPISLEVFVDRVLSRWLSNAKNPKSSVRTTIKMEYLGKSLLFLDESTLVPVNLAMQGVRYRVALSRQEVDRGWLFVFPSFQFMVKPGLKPEDFGLEEPDGYNIPVNLKTVKIRQKGFFGDHEVEASAFELGWWYKKHKVRRNDSLLVTILDWETGRLQLQLEPARAYKKHKNDIIKHNQAFADHLFETLENAKYESIWGQIAVSTAYLRLRDTESYPADHWLRIIEEDPRMQWTGYEIRYAEWRSMFEDFIPNEFRQPRAKPKPLPKKQAGQVYRFKAYLQYRKGLWRRIEIQGGQTLRDFDDILRSAFKHDTFDHLSGFWKLVRRGNTRRFREMDIGNIYPFEGGEAAEIRVADLEIKTGQMLKYVYDFGDWLEHRLELESIEEPEIGAEYPRIITQNKPRYKYCQTCKKEGRKTVATWVCITCSNDEQRDVLFCEECLDNHHVDHYVEELIY
jgi:hypothetical protein